MALISQDRLVRKEVSLGVIRELPPPETHISDTIAPWLEVQSDDVFFEYVKGAQQDLAPARAEDAEAELAMKDEFFGEGRASLIDWSIKDRYKPSDVSRYRNGIYLAQQIGTDLPLEITSMVADFDRTLALDEARRKRKLDNRREHMVIRSLVDSSYSYNDGKIRFSVSWGRPGAQTAQSPVGGDWTAANKANADPVGAINAVLEYMRDTYDGLRMTQVIASETAIRAMINSDKWALRSPAFSGDPNYTQAGFGDQTVRSWVELQTGVTFIPYDAVYRTRPIGSQTTTNNRFLPENTLIFLPDPAYVAELDDAIGFAKTLTSPHPEGNWTPGFYEWEQEFKDPWGTDRGTGVKMFPVFPHMDLTYTLEVLP